MEGEQLEQHAQAPIDIQNVSVNNGVNNAVNMTLPPAPTVSFIQPQTPIGNISTTQGDVQAEPDHDNDNSESDSH